MKKLSLFCALLTILVIADTIMYLRQGVSLSGYWSDKILVWMWIIASIMLTVKDFKLTSVKVYFSAVVSFLVLCAVPMMIPLISIIGYTLADDRNCVFYPMPNLRVQEDWIWAAPGRPSVKLIEQGVFFEEVAGKVEFERELIDSVTYMNFCDVENIRVLKMHSDSIQFQLEFKKKKIQQNT